MKSILNKIINVLCIAIIIAALGILFTVVSTPKGETPTVFGYAGFRVLTGSMEPVIRTNSFVLVKECDPSTIREGDIISFYSTDASLNGAVNTHRVTQVINDNGTIRFTTKGDANPIPDVYPVYASALVGKVVFRSHAIGLLVKLIANPIVFVIIIVIPLLLVIVTNARTMAREYKKIVEEEEENEEKGQ